MKTKNRLLALLAIIAFAIGMSASNVLADTFTAQASGNWGTLATWYNTTLSATATTLPGASDNVVIPATFTVSVNQNVEINNLAIGTTGTGIAVLKPDASSSRQITIDGDLTVGQGSTTNVGKILLDDGTGTGASSGRLSWVFTGSAGTSNISIRNDNSVASIDEEAIAAAYVKFYNLSFNTGNATLLNTDASYSGFYVYGDFTVTSVNFSITGVGNTNQTVYLNTYSSATKSVNNSGGDIKFYNLNIPSGAYITTAKDFTVEKNLSILGSLAQTSTSSITMTGATTTLTNSGTYTIGSNASLNINSSSVTLTNNISNMSGAITVGDADMFIVTTGKTITGTGSFTLGTNSILSLSNTGGFSSTIAITGTKSIVAGILKYEGGTTGITASGLTEVGGIIANGTITTTETFSIAKDLMVNASKSFTASAGTITFSGTNSGSITNAGTLSLYNASFARTSGTITLATAGFTVTGSLHADCSGGTIAFATFPINMTGTGNFSAPAGTFTTGSAAGGFFVVGGTITLDSNVVLGATGRLTLTSGSLDLKSYTLTGTVASAVKFVAGTVKTSSATGLFGNFSSYAASVLDAAVGINYTFNGTSSQTTLGFGFGAAIVSQTGSNIISLGDLTVAGGANAASSPAITTTGTAAPITALSGNISVTGYATLNLAFGANNAITMTGTKSITKASTATLSFSALSTAAAAITVATSSDFAIKGVFTVGAGSTFNASTPSTITLSNATGGSAATPVATGTLSFYNLTINGANVIAPTTNFAVTGDFDNAGATAFTAASASAITMSGTGKTIKSTGGSAVTFYDLLVTGGSITQYCNFTVAHNFTQSAGTFSYSGTPTLTLTGGGAYGITGLNAVATKLYNLSATGITTNAGALTIDNNLVFGGAAIGGATFTLAGTAATYDGTIPNHKLTGIAGVVSNFIVADGAKVNCTTATGATNVTINGTGYLILNGIVTATGTLTTASGSTVELAGAIADFSTALVATTAYAADPNTNYVFNNVGITSTGFYNTTVGDITILNAAVTAQTDNAAAAADITVNGNINISGGSFVTTASAKFIKMNTTGKSITRTAGTLTLYDLDIAAGATITADGDFSISGTGALEGLNLTATSVLTHNSGTLTFSGAAPVITVTAGGVLTLNNLTLGSGSAVALTSTGNFALNGNMDLGSQATSSLIPAAASTITFAGSGKTISTNVAADGSVGLNLGKAIFTGSYTQVGTHIIYITGSTFTVSGSFTQTSAQGTTFSYSGAVALTNTGALTLGDVVLVAGTLVTTPSSLNIAGDLTSTTTSKFYATAGTITFTTGGTITPAIDCDYSTTGLVGVLFNNVVVNGVYTIANNDVFMTGNLTVSSSLTHTYATTAKLTFTGTGAKTITNAGTLVLSNLVIGNVSGNNVSTTTDMTIAGNLNIGGAAGGTFTATAGNLTFGNAAAHSVITSTPTSLSLYSLTHAGTGFNLITFTGLTDLYLKGNLATTSTGNIVFPSTLKVTFNGAGEQTISKTAVAGSGKITFENTTVNNSASGIKLSGFTTLGDLLVNQTLKIQQGYVDLNGANIIQLLAGSNTTGYLQEAPGNTVRNSGTANGYISKTNNTGTLANINVGGLGAQFTTTASPTSVTVNRYHIARTVAGEAGISRYFEITTGGAGAGSTTLTFKYDSTELNGLNEANLNLLSSASATTGWTRRTATLDATVHYLRGTFATDFNTATTSYWTASAPSQVAISAISKGVGSLRFNDGRVDGYPNTKDTLTATTTNKAILGFKISTTNSAQVTGATVTLSRSVTAGTEFTKMYLYSSTDDDYSTSGDNTALDTVTVATGTTVAFTGLAETISAGSARNYFVVADIGPSVTTSTLPVTASVLSTSITLSNSVPVQNTITGPAFSFQPGVIFTKVVNGVSESPLVAGETNKTLIGFGAQGTAATGFSTFSLSFDQDSATLANLFSSWRLYRSTTINFDYTAGGQNTLVKTGVLSSTGVKFDITTTHEALSTSDKYYFIVVDVNGGVDPTDLRITPSISPSSVHCYDLTTSGSAIKNTDEEAGPVSTTSLVGNTYDFVNSKFVVSTENQIPAGNIGKGLSNQRLFGFTLTSLYSNSAVVSACSVKVDLTTAIDANFSNWRLWNDANGNSFPDATETNFSGTYSNGYVIFPMTSVTQTITSSKKYIITANVASTASSNGTVTISIPDQSYITATSPAIVENGGAWTGNVQTIKTPGTATNVVLSPQYVNTVVTGGTIAFTYQLQDANSTPVNASSAVALTLSSANGTTFGGTNTGSIAIGSDFVTINAALTNAGTTSESITCANASGYATPSAASPITITPVVPVAVISGDAVTLSENTSSPGTALTAVYNNANVNPHANVLIVMRAGAMPVAPTDGVTYVGLNDQNIGDASSVNTTGNGTFVVYNGVGTSDVNFSVYGLTPGTTYYFTTYVYSSSTAGLQKYATSLSSNNPVSRATTTADFATHGDKGVAASIQTDVNVPGAITTSNEQAWYKFYVNSSRSNLYIHLSDITNSKILKIELWNAAGTKMIRYASSVSAQNQTILINDAPAGTYLVKVTGLDDTQYSTSYTLRVNTKANANDYFSQPSR